MASSYSEALSILISTWFALTISLTTTNALQATSVTTTLHPECVITCQSPEILNRISCRCELNPLITTASPITPAPVTPAIITPDPTTPAPTNPSPVICDGTKSITGTFNDVTMTFEFLIPFHGDMFFYIDGFDVSSIRAYNKSSPGRSQLLTQTTAAGVSHVAILELPNSAEVIIEADGFGKGPFNAQCRCISGPPTFLPTQSPVTMMPSSSPITSRPTTNPITPSPTQPGLIQCDEPMTGDFNGERMMFHVQIPYYGDITFYINGLQVSSIRAYDAQNPTMKLAETAGANANHLTITDLTPFADIIFIVSGNGGKSVFNAKAECKSLAPTANPTTPSPTYGEQLNCGDPVFWTAFSDSAPPVVIEVKTTFDGELVFDASESFGFEITKIVAYDMSNLMRPLKQSNPHQPNQLIIPHLTANNVLFAIRGIGKGLLIIKTLCSTMSPTSNPSASPTTPSPTKPCPGNQIRDSMTQICACPEGGHGFFLPTCNPPFVRHPISCDCVIPTPSPTLSPTAPTTPRPTDTAHMLCGDPPHSGMINNAQQTYFDVRIPHGGRMTLRVLTANAESEITGITAYDLRNSLLPVIAQSNSGQLTISDLKKNADIGFKINGRGNGLYIASTICASDSPTKSPTKSPVTLIPTFPTMNPTPSPIEVSLQCGVSRYGEKDGSVVVFNMNMPFNGDITFFITGFAVNGITAYDMLDPFTILAQTWYHGVNRLSVPNVLAGTDILFRVQGIGTGLYRVTTQCSYSLPPNNNNNNYQISAPWIY